MSGAMNVWLRRALSAGLMVGAFGGVYFLGQRRKTSRLAAFAKCLSAKQAKMYGAYWCPHCAEQKEMFGGAFQYVSYMECGVVGSREEAPHCVQAGVKTFPAREFGHGVTDDG